ncbi:hypothetical protein PPERSA_11520 [Pseudocohnilembus persalinus]|uniref:Uncharacterized protein n=1 Tax=Pseudocohnilembus persalinus TaxID=266149 RepID=A0A0V0QXA8_PSEPJ|nr:hypothetical protein PPERSA_11520 [Pseudocohnilembus persalinus]|eukprot:KRX06875.1 hypothetical protein PPERSA_11520 [Pseudocohnilembus persalinus]
MIIDRWFQIIKQTDLIEIFYEESQEQYYKQVLKRFVLELLDSDKNLTENQIDQIGFYYRFSQEDYKTFHGIFIAILQNTQNIDLATIQKINIKIKSLEEILIPFSQYNIKKYQIEKNIDPLKSLRNNA